MKILQLITSLEGGGARRLMVDLSNELVSGHQVNVISLYDPKTENSYLKFLDKEIKVSSLSKKPGFDTKMIPYLYKTIRSINPDVIHNHLGSFNYLMPLIPFLNNAGIVHTIHSDAFEECPNKVIRTSRKFFFKIGGIIPVTISKESSNSFRTAYGNVDYEQIYNGRTNPIKSKNYSKVFDKVEGLKIDNKTIVFINIGRVCSAKNQLMLLKAFGKLIVEENYNAILLIIGKAKRKEKHLIIQKEIAEISEQHSQIHYLGYKENASDYLHASDYFCLSSIYEGMPITLIESLAAGCVPLCTPVGAIPEMIGHLEPSLLSDSVSIDDYLDLLKSIMYLSNERRKSLLKKLNELFINKYSIEYCALKYERLYKLIS